MTFSLGMTEIYHRIDNTISIIYFTNTYNRVLKYIIYVVLDISKSY